MKKNLTLLIVFISTISAGICQSWTNLANDAAGDGSNSILLDGKSLDYYYDQASDSLWFLITVDSITMAHSNAFGVNVMLNIPNGGPTFNFWGADNTDAFHKLLTVWVTGGAPSNYSGTIGVSDSSGVSTSNYTNLSSNNVNITVNIIAKTIKLGIKRSDLISNSEFSGNSIACTVAAAVGSNVSWNDDIYNSFAKMTLNKASTSIVSNTNSSGIIQVYPVPANNALTIKTDNSFSNTLKIYNSSGQLQMEINHFNSEKTIEIGDWPIGIYIIQVLNAMDIQNTIFIKQ